MRHRVPSHFNWRQLLTHKCDHLAESRTRSALPLFSIFIITEWLWKQAHIYISLLNCYQVGPYHCWPWFLTGQHNFHTLRHSSTKTTTLLTTQQVDVPRNSVCRPCEGFLCLPNIKRYYTTHADVIFATPIKVRPFLHRFMELILAYLLHGAGSFLRS